MMRLILFVCIVASVGAAVPLAENGTATAEIVLPVEAPPALRFAAQELKAHLDAMTGAEFMIVAARTTGRPAIVLGATAAEQAGLAVDSLARDGYLVGTRGDSVYIAGHDSPDKGDVLFTLDDEPFKAGSSKYLIYEAIGHSTPTEWDFERGTLYGVYRFLEELGVRWFWPGTAGMVLPSSPTLVAEVNLREEPSYIFRYLTPEWCVYPDRKPETLRRIAEHDALGLTPRRYKLWLLRQRESSQWLAFNHRPTRLKYEERFGETHPEYFAVLEDGKRDLKPVRGRTGHLCYTNKGMYEQTIRDIEAFFGGKTAEEMGIPAHRHMAYEGNRGWPPAACYGNSVSLLPHDSYRPCHCDTCRPLWRTEEGYRAQYSNLIWPFVARVGAAMQQAHPGKLAVSLAYSSYSEVPTNLERLPDNVVVGLCPAYLARDHDLADPELYDQMIDLARRWDAITTQPLLYWQHHLYRHRAPERFGVPMIMPTLTTRLIRDLRPYGNRVFMQVDTDSYLYEALHRYLTYRLLYDSQLDVEALIADYHAELFGSGAADIAAIYADLEPRCTAIAAEKLGRIDIWEKYLTEEVIAGYRQRIDRARELTRETPHAQAVALMDDWFVSLIEEGHARYVKDVRTVAENQNARITIRSSRGETIDIDGDLSDPAWAYSARVHTRSNIDGTFIKPLTTVRFLRHPDFIYVSFDCELPAASHGVAELPGEWVEVFLDPEHDHQSYFQLLVKLDGSTTSHYFEARGEQAVPWQSEAQIGIQRGESNWTVEIAIPRSSLGLVAAEDPRVRPWGANFCRTMQDPRRPEDRFGGYSPLLRGKFHQPDLFGHIVFRK